MADKPKIPKFESALTGLSALAFIASVGALVAYEVYLSKYSAAPYDVIATVQTVNKTTKRRMPDSFDFHDIRTSDPLGNGDYIFSGDESRVTLKFTNGPRLVIGQQSLVVLRQIDGTPEVKIENGTLSGTFEQSDVIEIATDEEVVILNGENDTQFSASYSAAGGLEIGSFGKDLKLEFNGKKFTLKNQSAKVSQGKGVEVKNPTAGAPDKSDRETASVPEKPQMPKGLGIEEISKDRSIALTPPYPQANQMFFHTAGGSIPVYPKKSCQGPCEIKLFVGGKEIMSRTFDRDMAPLLYLKADTGTESEIKWEFSDGDEKTNGSFSVMPNNPANFQKAFTNKFPVEVMN